MKKIISMILCISVLLSMLCTTAVPTAAAESVVTLKYYDDRMDISGMDAEITDAGTPVSNKVGYGVAEGTKDSAVLTLENGVLIATGVGEGKVRLDGTEYTVKIEAAPLSVFLLIGQSNMEGDDGNIDQSVANEDGQVYSTYTSIFEIGSEDRRDYIPSALSGEYSTVNINGTTTGISDHPVNALCESGNGKKGVDSALAYEWNKQTGKKVWIVNAAVSGSPQSTWYPGAMWYERAKFVMQKTYETLGAEIAAGHYTLDHLGYFWCQGESDSAVDAQAYAEDFITMHNGIKNDFVFDHDGDASTDAYVMEFANILTIRAATTFGGAGYRQGEYADATELPETVSFLDLQMTGPRVAQYWLGNNPDHPDINVVTNITENWVYMPDGTSGVSEYFNSRYENGRVDYPTQTEQTELWRTPTTPEEVHAGVHYYQIGYNEIGRDAARNTCYLLGEAEPPAEQVSVKLLSWDGYNAFGGNISADIGAESLAVPVVSPLYMSKSLTVTCSEGYSYDYYDLTGITEGEIKATVGEVSLSVKLGVNAPKTYKWQYSEGELVSVTDNGEENNTLTRLEGTTDENGVFSSSKYALEHSVVLLHDRAWSVEWKAAAGTYMLFASDESASNEGAQYLHLSKLLGGISMGERVVVDGKKAYDSYGVSLQDHGISTADEHVYKLVNVPGGAGNSVWLYVDGVKIACLAEHNNGSAWDEAGTGSLSGMDFKFSYMGGKPYTLNNCTIEYISVDEGVETAADHIRGDVDMDGDVTMLDLYQLKLMLKGQTDATEYADIDGDGEVNMIDSYTLKLIIKGY